METIAFSTNTGADFLYSGYWCIRHLLNQAHDYQVVAPWLTDLVETPVEDLFNVRPVEGDCLEISLVVVIEEGQSFPTIWNQEAVSEEAK